MVLDYSVLVQVVAFLFLWFLLTRLLFRPFLGLLQERERRTEGVKAESASMMAEAERLRAQYEAGIAKANDDGRAVKESLVREARQAREQLLAQAREEASRMLEAVRDEVQRELQRGREQAAREAEVIARQMAEKILGRKVA